VPRPQVGGDPDPAVRLSVHVYGRRVLTVGVDLAAEAARTAVAGLRWGPGRVDVVEMVLGADDARVLAAVAGADRAALDFPFGWPDPFVDFLVQHRAGHVVTPTGQTGLAWRRSLSRRQTDLAVERDAGVRPLSVSADRIAAVAMRGAGLLGAIVSAGEPVDRSGAGRMVESYPAAALSRWDLPSKGLKGRLLAEVLDGLVDRLLAALPGLHLGDAEALVRRSDDAFDAVVCALVARAAARGGTARPPAGLQGTAAREGWIALPTVALADLVTT